MSVPDNDPNSQRAAAFYDAPRERPAPPDYSDIAAALARFEAKLACRSYLPRGKAGRVWTAFALLTFAAVGGGLSLARFSFNSPETPVAVLTHAPEMMYLPPQNHAAAFAMLEAEPRSNEAATIAISLAARTNAEPWLSGGDSSSSATPRAGEFDPAAASEPRDLNLHELGRSWAEAVRIASAMQWSSVSRSSEPLQHGYSAVEISAIPEASTGLTVAFAIATILGWNYAAQRRKQALRCGDHDVV